MTLPLELSLGSELRGSVWSAAVYRRFRAAVLGCLSWRVDSCVSVQSGDKSRAVQTLRVIHGPHCFFTRGFTQ